MGASQRLGQGVPASPVSFLPSKMNQEDDRVDIPDLTQSVEALRRRYLDLRGLRTELSEFNAAEPLPTAPLPSWLVASCLRFDPNAPTPDREALEAFLQQEAETLVEQLSNERESQWEQQGRMLRYSLIMLQNRVQTLQADLDREGSANDQAAAHRGLLQRLEDQVDTLRRTIEHWQDARLVTEACSLAQIAAFVEDPYHEGDKEHLGRILERGGQAKLPLDQVCIELVWDRVSGRVKSAKLIPADRHQAA